jgi:hypothetical protein
MFFVIAFGRRGGVERALAVQRGTIIALVLALAGTAAGTSVPRLSLDRIAHDADRIVYGTVTDVRSGRDEAGLPATWVTLSVVRALKGPVGRELTLKQFGVDTPLPDGTAASIPGLPRYVVGEQVVLFLHADSRRGFTSPIGLGQGTYRVRHRGGRAVVRGDDVPGQQEDLGAFLDGVGRMAGTP